VAELASRPLLYPAVGRALFGDVHTPNYHAAADLGRPDLAAGPRSGMLTSPTVTSKSPTTNFARNLHEPNGYLMFGKPCQRGAAGFTGRSFSADTEGGDAERASCCLPTAAERDSPIGGSIPVLPL